MQGGVEVWCIGVVGIGWNVGSLKDPLQIQVLNGGMLAYEPYYIIQLTFIISIPPQFFSMWLWNYSKVVLFVHEWVILSCLSPRCVCSLTEDEALAEALDLMGPMVMVSGDCEHEGTMVPLRGWGLYGWVTWEAPWAELKGCLMGYMIGWLLRWLGRLQENRPKVCSLIYMSLSTTLRTGVMLS